MSEKIRTRFAPSPTGFLHLGSIRTALFCWLYARSTGGDFILRIEDTDNLRSEQAYSDLILEGMTWLGLDWDEGPIYQSNRYERYNNLLDDMVNQEKAYYCDCSPERLNQIRAEQMARGENPHYDGHCRDKKLQSSSSTVVRLKFPKTGSLHFSDIVHGEIHKEYYEVDDWIARRTDGHPTYNYAVVVDDFDMQITDVIRGDDHLNNTPKQVALYKLLNWPTPRFCHIPMILDEHGARLSKRSGSANAMQYREEGFLKEGLLNAIVRLGWSHKDQEIFTIKQMIESFNLASLQSSAACFNHEKFLWTAKQHMMLLSDEEILNRIREEGFFADLSDEFLLKVVSLFRGRFHSFKDLSKQATFIHSRPQVEVHELYEAHPNLKKNYLINLTQWFEDKDIMSESFFKDLKAFAISQGIKIQDLTLPLRMIITGSHESPDLTGIIRLLGKEEIIKRISYFTL